ncbi:hypothetical protein [Roseicella frigidaeris]|uniref:hypothetical protein n=1 Tax=Roseicella frigidaeris TaxID=2230885 RepID=UPI001FB1C199|nr:hypothetical protein [Roseicella frigidaeris]
MPRSAPGGSTMPIGKGLHGIAQIPQQMPAVRNLPGSWGALSDPISIGPGTVACDHLG